MFGVTNIGAASGSIGLVEDTMHVTLSGTLNDSGNLRDLIAVIPANITSIVVNIDEENIPTLAAISLLGMPTSGRTVGITVTNPAALETTLLSRLAVFADYLLPTTIPVDITMSDLGPPILISLASIEIPFATCIGDGNNWASNLSVVDLTTTETLNKLTWLTYTVVDVSTTEADVTSIGVNGLPYVPTEATNADRAAELAEAISAVEGNICLLIQDINKVTSEPGFLLIINGTVTTSLPTEPASKAVIDYLFTREENVMTRLADIEADIVTLNEEFAAALPAVEALSVLVGDGLQSVSITFTADIIPTDALTVGFVLTNDVTGVVTFTGLKACACVASGATYEAGDFTFDLGAITGDGIATNTATNFALMVNANNFSPDDPQTTTPMLEAVAVDAVVTLTTNKLVWIKMDAAGVVDGINAHATLNFFPDHIHGSGDLTHRSIAVFLSRINQELRLLALESA